MDSKMRSLRSSNIQIFSVSNEQLGNKNCVLYCIVLYCIVLYCIVLYCVVLYCRYHELVKKNFENFSVIYRKLFGKSPECHF